LIRVGFDDVLGYLEGGIEAWETAGQPLGHVDTLSVHDLAKERPTGTLLDVRTPGEWNAGHVEGAVHVPVGELPNRLGEVRRGQPVQVICGSGYRASIAASLLKRAGYDAVANVVGGMSAWKAAGLPTTTK
jgi:hydroxyacylglutathione hydrolase